MDTLAQKEALRNGCSINEVACALLENLVNEVLDETAQETAKSIHVSRNGYRTRSLQFAIGTLKIKIPCFREDTFFPDEFLVRWSRTDTALAACVARMWALGISHRKIEKVQPRLNQRTLS